MKWAYHKGIQAGLENGIFKFLGQFEDLKEDFEIPTNLVRQPSKPGHPQRVTLDMLYMNEIPYCSP